MKYPLSAFFRSSSCLIFWTMNTLTASSHFLKPCFLTVSRTSNEKSWLTLFALACFGDTSIYIIYWSMRDQIGKTDLTTSSRLNCIEVIDVTWLPFCQLTTNEINHYIHDNHALIYWESSVQWTGIDNSEILCAN